MFSQGRASAGDYESQWEMEGNANPPLSEDDANSNAQEVNGGRVSLAYHVG